MVIRQRSIPLVTFTEESYESGQQLLGQRSEQTRKAQGQYLTPPPAAFFMVHQLGAIHDGDRILDPAIGAGTLLCAVIETLVQQGQPLEILVEGYETDAELYGLALENINEAVQKAASQGIIIRSHLHNADFVRASIDAMQPSLFDLASIDVNRYQKIIANPPYFKLNAEEPISKLVKNYLPGSTNIYTVFMALAATLLEGRACFFVPRSFCSGAYFAEFRRKFLNQVTLKSVHLFDSRQVSFKPDNVLQENLIITFDHFLNDPTNADSLSSITISTSASTNDLSERRYYHTSAKSLIGRRDGNLFLRFPLNELDEQLIESMDSWPYHLRDFGWEVSTGRVVAFRSRDYLYETPQRNHVPLLWLQNIQPLNINWPLKKNGGKPKPQWISTIGSESLLIPISNFVIVRRFSAKEEARRLVAAPLLSHDWQYQSVGLENHLNYIYRTQGEMTPTETTGLSIYYNSGLADRYFRLVNGNTQVNATELRALPLPPIDALNHMGRRFFAERQSHEKIVLDTLKEANLVPKDFPLLLETRNT